MKSLLVINVVAFEDSILLNVDTNVPAYKANAETGAYEQTEDTSFSMSYADLARQVYPLNADIAELRALRGQHLSGEDCIKLLTGATIEVDFTFVNEGDKSDDAYDGMGCTDTGGTSAVKSLRRPNYPAGRLDRAVGLYSARW